MTQRRSAKPGPKAKRAPAIVLRGDYALAQAENLKAILAGVVARAAPVVLDASAVTCIDAAGLQVLTVFVRERQAQGRSVSWRGVPTSLSKAARQLGLAAALSLSPA